MHGPDRTAAGAAVGDVVRRRRHEARTLQPLATAPDDHYHFGYRLVRYARRASGDLVDLGGQTRARGHPHDRSRPRRGASANLRVARKGAKDAKARQEFFASLAPLRATAFLSAWLQLLSQFC